MAQQTNHQPTVSCVNLKSLFLLEMEKIKPVYAPKDFFEVTFTLYADYSAVWTSYPKGLKLLEPDYFCFICVKFIVLCLNF